jgi:hypothetical protein
MATALFPQILPVIATVAAPFVAGLAVVLWSKWRSARQLRALARIDEGVRQVYSAVEAAPVPPPLAVTVDALAEADEMAAMAQASRPLAAPRKRQDA